MALLGSLPALGCAAQPSEDRGDASPSSGAFGAAVSAAISTASASASASTPLPANRDVPPPAASSAPADTAPEPGRTVGDVTCTVDADCTITTRNDCCDCCAGPPRATSRAWLAWRDGTLCKQTRCEPCGKVKCPSVADPALFVARCQGKRCALMPR